MRFGKVINIGDITPTQALRALKCIRKIFSQHDEPEEVYRGVVSTVGGRLSHLRNVASHPDMLAYTRQLLHMEKAWLLSKIGLIPGHDVEMLDRVCVRTAEPRGDTNHGPAKTQPSYMEPPQ